MEKADITKNDALAWTNELVRLGVNSRFLSAVIASISYSGGYATSLLFSQNKDILLWLVVFSPAISIMSFYLFSQKIKISYVVFNYIIFFSLIIAETYISVNFFKIGDSFLSVGLVPIFITFALLAQWDTKHSIFAVLGTALSSFFCFLFHQKLSNKSLV